MNENSYTGDVTDALRCPMMCLQLNYEMLTLKRAVYYFLHIEDVHLHSYRFCKID